MKLITRALVALLLVCGLSSVASAQTAATVLILSALCGDPQDGQTLIYDADNDEWGCGSPADLVQPLIDSIAIVKNADDATKLLKFSLAGITPGTTRMVTFPDADITLPTSFATLGANTFVGNQGITGTVTATGFAGPLTGNVTGDVSGNAGTVTNGVYTSGSYSDPSWLTALAWSKVTGEPTTLSGYGITDAQPLDADLTSWAGVTRASGFDTFTATASSANLRALLTDEVGTGAAYFVGGALGTPASATLTNATGLPISTGVSGLGTGVATFLATPSGANLASALTSALPVSKGGTGLTTVSAGDMIYASATDTLSTISACADGEFIGYESGVPTCSSSTAEGHNILSATHTDTTSASVQRGDLMAGVGSTPKWERIPIGDPGQVLTVDSEGEEVGWEDPPSVDLPTVLAAVYPVGSIYTSTVSTNPNTLFGFGTWEAFGAGRVLVGVNGSDSDFNTVEKTGGSKTHTLTIEEMPSHTHTQNAHNHGVTDPGHAHGGYNTGGASGVRSPGSDWGFGNASTTEPSVVRSATTGVTTNNTTATNQNTGGGAAHNNLQPYITVYFWKRTA